MFFILSKTLNFLTSPLSWIFLMIIFSLVFRKKILYFLALGLFIFFSNPLIVNSIYSNWEYPATPLEEESYPVAIVLTGMVIPEISIDNQIQLSDGAERITESLRLYHSGKIKNILVAGGSGHLSNPDLKESPRLRKLALALQVPETNVFMEDQSKNTYETAVNVKPILDENFDLGSSKILLVTSAYHMRRALACFQKQELNIQPYAVDFHTIEGSAIGLTSFLPSTSAILKWDRMIHEWIGFLAYRAMGYV